MDFEIAIGGEQAGSNRPAIVVSANTFNRSPIQVVTVVPLTSLEGKKRPVFAFETVIRKGVGGTISDSIALPQQVRTISKLRLVEKMGSIASRSIRESIEDGLLALFGIDLDPAD